MTQGSRSAVTTMRPVFGERYLSRLPGARAPRDGEQVRRQHHSLAVTFAGFARSNPGREATQLEMELFQSAKITPIRDSPQMVRGVPIALALPGWREHAGGRVLCEHEAAPTGGGDVAPRDGAHRGDRDLVAVLRGRPAVDAAAPRAWHGPLVDTCPGRKRRMIGAERKCERATSKSRASMTMRGGGKMLLNAASH